MFSDKKQILEAGSKHPSKEMEVEFITKNFLYHMQLK